VKGHSGWHVAFAERQHDALMHLLKEAVLKEAAPAVFQQLWIISIDGIL
jgi:hypothetical protein